MIEGLTSTSSTSFSINNLAVAGSIFSSSTRSVVLPSLDRTFSLEKLPTTGYSITGISLISLSLHSWMRWPLMGVPAWTINSPFLANMFSLTSTYSWCSPLDLSKFMMLSLYTGTFFEKFARNSASVSVIITSLSYFLPLLSSTSISPVRGSKTGLLKTRPKMLDSKSSIIISSSRSEVASNPLWVPQSDWVTTIPWATSTSLLVKYPAFDVLKAVSAAPFLPPWVDRKNSETLNPSRKLDRIGISIISPAGPAINPLIPASCFSWSSFPLAPDEIIIWTGL